MMNLNFWASSYLSSYTSTSHDGLQRSHCYQAEMLITNSIVLNLIRVLQHGVVSGCEGMAFGNFSRLRVGTEWSSKQQDEGLWSMNFVVHPATWLLNSKLAPLFFEQETVAGHLLVGSSGKEDMSIFVFVVLVLLRVLNLIGEVRHSISNSINYYF